MLRSWQKNGSGIIVDYLPHLLAVVVVVCSVCCWPYFTSWHSAPTAHVLDCILQVQCSKSMEDTWRAIYSNSYHGCPRYIHARQSLNSSITTTGCSEEPEQHVDHLEHVVVKVLIVHPRRGDLEINLISPSGTRSQLLAKRWELHCTHQGTLQVQLYMKPTIAFY